MKSLGDAAAEEWIKGLEDLGKQRRHDAARWERWEDAGGLAKMQREARESGFIDPSVPPSQALTRTVQKHAHFPPETQSNLNRQFTLRSPHGSNVSMLGRAPGRYVYLLIVL